MSASDPGCTFTSEMCDGKLLRQEAVIVPAAMLACGLSTSMPSD